MSRPGWFFDRQGRPMTPEQYEVTCEEGNWEAARRVAQDIVIVGGEPCNVSTVWLGIDMGFGRYTDGPPVIFESMVFGGPYDQAQARYCTELDAQEGHVRAVADLAAGHSPWFVRDDEDSEVIDRG